jgi:protocatechuate 3,4-dioxygenase beta subunit
MAHQDLLLHPVENGSVNSKQMERISGIAKFLLSLFLFNSTNGCHQNATQTHSSTVQDITQIIGGRCESCELMYEGMPAKLQWSDTLPGWNEAGQKIEIAGTIFKSDGRTPAKDVILYLYHTDSKGYYSRAPDQKIGLRHGRIRGWVKTNDSGQYRFYTNKPAPYPGEKIPAHIHVILKEPGKNEYYIDEIEFEDDPFLTKEERTRYENRGGPGIIKLIDAEDQVFHGRRDIILGLNIPDYH